MDVHLVPTAILDLGSAPIADFGAFIDDSENSQLGFLKAAHSSISTRIQPVYSVNERQPVSVTISKRVGSCSQRMACLEAVARLHGIGTRVRALWLRGSFWRPRFPWLSPLLPQRVLLLWPQFRMSRGWLDFDQLYAEELRRRPFPAPPFRNDAESLFEAVASTTIGLFPAEQTHDGCPCTGVSEFVLEDAGFFDSRDAALECFGNLYDTITGRTFEYLYGGKPSRQQRC